MAGFTYETRSKMTENWVKAALEKGAGLSELEKKFLPKKYYTPPEEAWKHVEKLLDRPGTKLSDVYRKHLSKVVNVCVPENLRDEFFYALDEMNQYQMTAGWLRRSVRSTSYKPFAKASVQLLWGYSKLGFYGGDLADVLTGNVDPEIYDHARTEYWSYNCMLAAQIDRGNEKTIQAIKDILLGEGNTAMISHEMIRGLVKCKDQAMYQLLGDFLLAARLQEGARQAVCETMDAGRPEAFLHLFQVIEENNLVRYSSVKRAVSTWIGIFNEKSVDRITEKLVRLMGQCLREPSFCEEQLQTNDSIAISCALWAKGFFDAEDAIQAEQKLIHTGTKNQKMTASYFNQSLQYPELKMKAAKEVLLTWPDDLELAACFMPGFMADTYSFMVGMVRRKEDGHYYSVDAGVRMPDKRPVTDMFESEEEARRLYGILKNLMSMTPKKGIQLNPCIFPWYCVTMSQSDLAWRMCLIAWLLQDEAILDEAAQLIPVIGQGQYYGSYRSLAARVLLYRPETEARKNVLFSLLHNPEEYTMTTAFLLVGDMELTGEDYRKIEENLKYKKGREKTLALLRKQDKEALKGSISRLLRMKSEECHMGALDLALEIKKESETEFEKIRPELSVLTEPTGKEKVLLDELKGKSSEAQDIVNTPGYGLYDTSKDWVIPPIQVDEREASKLFVNGEKACIDILNKLNSLIEENRELEYKTAWDRETVLGSGLERCRWTGNDANAKPLDGYPFPELWLGFYEKEIKTPEMLMELYLYQQCRKSRTDYERNLDIYKKVFGSGLLKKPPFQNLVQGLRYGAQAATVIDNLFEQLTPSDLKARWGLVGMAKLLSVLDEKNAIFEAQEKRYGGTVVTYTKRAANLPIFFTMRLWLKHGEGKDWDSAFAIRFHLSQIYEKLKDKEKHRYTYEKRENYLFLSDFVQCYIRGIWDKDLFYKGVFTFMDLGRLLKPVTTVEQKGNVLSREARQVDLNDFFGVGAITPVDGKYRFDNIGDEMPAMKLAHEIYREVMPVILKVELKRGEGQTPFSSCIVSSVRVVYGIDTMVKILTALGKDTLSRSSYYYSGGGERKNVLSHLLKVCRPEPEETAQDLKKALKGTDITKKRLVELAMYAPQWIPIIGEHLKMPGLQSGCYYFMAHTSDGMDEFTTSMVAKYTPFTPEELRDGAFDIQWFFEAYGKLGEKDFKLLYDAAKYSSSGTAHARARKYADAALGNVEKESLKAEISGKRNKDLLMSLGLLPLDKGKKKKEDDMLDRYQFIQKFKKESKQFGAQRRASEGRAVDLALRNLSANAGFTDVTRLTLRMETKLVENMGEYFSWKALEEIQLCISVDENGKSSLQCRKGDKTLKSIPAKYKKSDMVLEYQNVNKKLKEQYSRTKQMMEQAMEDRTSFEVWEIRELSGNPVVRPIMEPLVFKLAKTREDGKAPMGFLTEAGLSDWSGAVAEVKKDDKVIIAHPYDLYEEGHWHEYQKLLFEKQIKQPFKQVFRELYVKLAEELEKDESMMFSGNQIQPQKTVGALRGRRWVADYEDGLQKIYYKENIVARIYAMADWFSPSDIEVPTLEYVVFSDRKTFQPLKIKDIPDIIYSEVMRDVDLAVSVAHAGGVDPETSHSTVEMRKAIVECNLELFKIKNVRVEGSHAIIDGKLGQYTVHLGSGVVHQMGNSMLFVVPVHSQHRGRLFLPFVDDDPKTAEIMSKILLFAEDTKIKDPNILSQIR